MCTIQPPVCLFWGAYNAQYEFSRNCRWPDLPSDKKLLQCVPHIHKHCLWGQMNQIHAIHSWWTCCFCLFQLCSSGDPNATRSCNARAALDKHRHVQNYVPVATNVENSKVTPPDFRLIFVTWRKQWISGVFISVHEAGHEMCKGTMASGSSYLNAKQWLISASNTRKIKICEWGACSTQSFPRPTDAYAVASPSVSGTFRHRTIRRKNDLMTTQKHCENLLPLWLLIHAVIIYRSEYIIINGCYCRAHFPHSIVAPAQLCDIIAHSRTLLWRCLRFINDQVYTQRKKSFKTIFLSFFFFTPAWEMSNYTWEMCANACWAAVVASTVAEGNWKTRPNRWRILFNTVYMCGRGWVRERDALKNGSLSLYVYIKIKHASNSIPA